MNFEHGTYQPGSSDHNPYEQFWNKTVAVEARLQKDVNQAKYFEEAGEEPDETAKFKGRHLIGRDRPILGGVYVGAGAREAIVVDEKHGELVPIYHELLAMRAMAMKEGKGFKDDILKDVWQLVMDKIPYSEAAVESLAEESAGKKDYKEALDSYIIVRGGVCRHQALLAGYLLEKLISEGKLNGKVSVDRNSVPGKGGHAWVRYTNSQNKVFIIDPAQEYIGGLDNVENTERWFYERPEDMVNLREQN